MKNIFDTTVPLEDIRNNPPLVHRIKEYGFKLEYCELDHNKLESALSITGKEVWLVVKATKGRDIGMFFFHKDDTVTYDLTVNDVRGINQRIKNYSEPVKADRAEFIILSHINLY